MGFEFRPSESNTHFYLLYCTVSKVCIWRLGESLVGKTPAGEKDAELASHHLCKKVSTSITLPLGGGRDRRPS